jgi:uncharacterized membrane protein YedE/YeeE
VANGQDRWNLALALAVLALMLSVATAADTAYQSQVIAIALADHLRVDTRQSVIDAFGRLRFVSALAYICTVLAAGLVLTRIRPPTAWTWRDLLVVIIGGSFVAIGIVLAGSHFSSAEPVLPP